MSDDDSKHTQFLSDALIKEIDRVRVLSAEAAVIANLRRLFDKEPLPLSNAKIIKLDNYRNSRWRWKLKTNTTS
jgi:hypothetical protein